MFIKRCKTNFFVTLVVVALIFSMLSAYYPVKAASNLIAEYNDEAIIQVGNSYRDKQGNYLLAVGETATFTATQSAYSAVSAIDWQIDKSSNLSIVGGTPDVNSCRTTVTVRGVRPGTVTLNGRVFSTYSNGMVYDAQWCDNPFPIRVVEPLSRLTLSTNSVSLAQGQSAKIEVSQVTPDSLYSMFASTPMSWRSSNTSVARVDSGTITAVGRGTAVITVSTSTGVTASCTVNVAVTDSSNNSANKVTADTPAADSANDAKEQTVKPRSIKLSKNKLTLVKGRSVELKATVSPKKAVTKITWKSSKPRVASVDKSGKVTARKKGSTVITARTGNGKKSTCRVSVTVPKAKKIKLNKTSLTINPGEKERLQYTILPDGAKTKVKFKSSRPKVASVSKKGVITAKKAGKTTIKAVTSNGKKAVCSVVVTKKDSIAGPADKPEKNVQTSTSNVSNTTDTPNTPNAQETPAATHATSVSISGGLPYIRVGEALELKAQAAPSDTTDTISWTSDDTSVATVSADGRVYGIKDGGVTITARAGDVSESVQLAVVSGDVYDISNGELLVLADNVTNSTVKYCGKEYDYDTVNGVTIVQSDPTKSNNIRIGGGKVKFANVNMSGISISVTNYSKPGDIIIEFMKGTKNSFSGQNAPISVNMMSDSGAPDRLIIRGGGEAVLRSNYGPALSGSNITISNVTIAAHVVTEDCAVIGTYSNTDCENITIESDASITVYGGYKAVGAGLGGTETDILISPGTVIYGSY